MMQRMSPEQQEKMNRIHAKVREELPPMCNTSTASRKSSDACYMQIQQEQMAGTLDQRKMTVYQQELMANFTDEQRREMMEMRQKVRIIPVALFWRACKITYFCLCIAGYDADATSPTSNVSLGPGALVFSVSKV